MHLPAQGTHPAQARVRELFDYDPGTGHLTWKVKKGRVRPGDRAGHDHKARYYRVVEFDARKYKEHRVIWLWWHGQWPENHIDHVNRVKTDNRVANLREATQAQNMQNIGISSRNKSGILGVCYTPENTVNKWRAYIVVGKKTKMLGSYPTKEKAAEARRIAEAQYHPFSNPSLPGGNP